MIYAVDFNGTLCVNLYPKIGKPRSAVVEYIKQAKDAGGTIILWTCREGKLLDQAVQWCKDQEIPIDLVNTNDPSVVDQFGNDCRKVYADFYIDDRAICADDLVRRSILRMLSPPGLSWAPVPRRPMEWQLFLQWGCVRKGVW